MCFTRAGSLCEVGTSKMTDFPNLAYYPTHFPGLQTRLRQTGRRQGRQTRPWPVPSQRATLQSLPGRWRGCRGTRTGTGTLRQAAGACLCNRQGAHLHQVQNVGRACLAQHTNALMLPIHALASARSPAHAVA